MIEQAEAIAGELQKESIWIGEANNLFSDYLMGDDYYYFNKYHNTDGTVNLVINQDPEILSWNNLTGSSKSFKGNNRRWSCLAKIREMKRKVTTNIHWKVDIVVVSALIGLKY